MYSLLVACAIPVCLLCTHVCSSVFSVSDLTVSEGMSIQAPHPRLVPQHELDKAQTHVVVRSPTTQMEDYLFPEIVILMKIDHSEQTSVLTQIKLRARPATQTTFSKLGSGEKHLRGTVEIKVQRLLEGHANFM